MASIHGSRPAHGLLAAQRVVSYVRVPVQQAPGGRRLASIGSILIAFAALMLAPGLPVWIAPVIVIVTSVFALFRVRRKRRPQRCRQGRQISLDTDGAARLFRADGSATPATIRFAWVGSRSVRIVLIPDDGARQEIFVERAGLAVAQWRCVRAWFVWMERQRGRKNHGISKPG